ncbi:PD-(D/E)XK nuclease family protein [Acaryochloris thomasi]|uniref:PD-(D/E)XK nuclease family protein n=1 Tax=Acaryochloris thomasi TaxID=2929456 RepID=UPI001313FF4A
MHHLKKQITDSLEARLEKQYRLIGHLYLNALREVFLNFGIKLKAFTGKGLQEFTNLRNVGYKTTKLVSPPDAVDIQLGLYDLLLKQAYQQALHKLSLIYLRTGEKVTYEVTPEHRKESKRLIEKLAVSLQKEDEWRPKKGEQCDRCSYQRYCSVTAEVPEPIPDTARKPKGMQLLLPF